MPLSRKGMVPSAQRRPCYFIPSQAQRPKNLREEVTLEGGRPGVPASLGSLTEGQQYAAEAQHPQGPHGARRESLKSLLIAGAASAPPPLRISSSHLTPRGPPTTPKQVRLLFTPLLAGGGRETQTHQSCRTTHSLYPMGTRGGDLNPPTGAVQVRCPMPEAWLLQIGHS